jgi:hypothetical protein
MSIDCTDYELTYSWSLEMRENHGKKAFRSKEASFRRAWHTQTFDCQITENLCWAPSEVTVIGEEHHGNVEGAGNTYSSVSGESAHFCLNQNACEK